MPHVVARLVDPRPQGDRKTCPSRLRPLATAVTGPPGEQRGGCSRALNAPERVRMFQCVFAARLAKGARGRVLRERPLRENLAEGDKGTDMSGGEGVECNL